MSIARWNLKEAGGKLLARRIGITLGICRLGKVAIQTEAQNYPEAYGVNVAGRWEERLRSYPGRSHGRAETKRMKHG